MDGVEELVHANGLVIAREDSAFYAADVLTARRRAGARFSVTARMSSAVKAAGYRVAVVTGFFSFVGLVFAGALVRWSARSTEGQAPAGITADP